jgi:hypothetical protein
MTDELAPPAVAPASLASRVATRRATLQAQSTTTLEVPGFEGILAATYRALSWKEMRSIGLRHERLSDEALQELYVAADTLILACEDVLEVLDGGERRSLGKRWGTALAQHLGVELPENANPRTALFALFSRDTDVMTHYSSLVLWQERVTEKVDETVVEDFAPAASSS